MRRFNIIREISKIGFIVIFEVTDRVEGQNYTVKRIHLPDVEGDQLVQYTGRELKNLAQFRHSKHVVNYVTAWVEKPRRSSDFYVYVQMELVQESLEDWIVDRNKSLMTCHKKIDMENLDFFTAFNYFFQMAWSVKIMHEKNFIHRDLKPENFLFVTDESNERLLKLANLELAVIAESSKQLLTPRVGSHLFAAPEVMQKGKELRYDAKADMFSLGVIMVALFFPTTSVDEFAKLVDELTKPEARKKFHFPSPVHNIFPESRELLFKLIDDDPKNRPKSRELLEQLSAFVASHSEIEWENILGLTFYECGELRQQIHAARI